MTDEHTKGAISKEQGSSEERLRALTGDRKPKTRGKGKPTQDDPQRRPGDVVDAVRERTNKDRGKDLTR
jgi:hypothetical protein